MESGDVTFTTPRTLPRAETIFSFMSPRTKSEPAPREPTKGRSKARPSSSKQHKTCLYRTGKCNNQRHVKANGLLHKLCTFHRSKANENQRRLDRKKKDAGFHRRERISAFKVKGVLQPKASMVMRAHSNAFGTAPPQLLHPFEDILPDVMIPFLLDSYTDVTDDVPSTSTSFHVL
ncbi:hypothetical protein H310_05488 [Aphanomyces invadans]|uniref:Uncharacterized protein n=1 Tax=Aphanomyces invadans TaxID=157072 RepID=A0A024U9V7_9STRA|nr:hypothetical protein H310_05488 [Aphanomyces invadans]ETW03059.1 hypothetical protein H310_05488 [Aphanomyces invadans]RHY34391.1 hypothetical protein DYB32_000974 [Aphanomyces invadans]|eukprot:XP_008868443.1 hypothetical protein H310_05488 [Aphanomyces invadans]